MRKEFVPKLLSVLREGYTRKQLQQDILAGVIVGIVALPLSIAFAIASGVTPEKGLVTAIIAGFVIAILGGSKVQISGPTGAFIVIIYGIVEAHGVSGLTIATFIAGFMLIIMGVARFGSVIKYIPHSLIVGFTSGIALIIFSSQVKDFLGLEMGAVPSDFVSKWWAYFGHLHSINPYAVGIAVLTILVTLYSHKLTTRIPGPLLAILLATALVQIFQLPMETIASRFGEIPSSIPAPQIPAVNWETFQQLVEPAFTIALLGAIESLLSAVVADGMIGDTHRSNMELIGQGAGNILSGLFGGIPATGAIARTATNVKNGGRTPVSGIVHAITLLAIMLFVGKWAKLIPLAALAGILTVVAYNMSEWKSFLSITRGPRSDVAVLLVTFFLTVFFDLTLAIEIGMVLAAFLFMRRMAQISKVRVVTEEMQDVVESQNDPMAIGRFDVPQGVDVYEIKGPLFFGAAQNFKEAIRDINRRPQILIIRMRQVPIIDMTGLHNLKETIKSFQASKTRIILSGVQTEVFEELEKGGVVAMVGEANIRPNIHFALERARELLANQ